MRRPLRRRWPSTRRSAAQRPRATRARLRRPTRARRRARRRRGQSARRNSTTARSGGWARTTAWSATCCAAQAPGPSASAATPSLPSTTPTSTPSVRAPAAAAAVAAFYVLGVLTRTWGCVVRRAAKARHFIYIENQFFTSSCGPATATPPPTPAAAAPDAAGAGEPRPALRGVQNRIAEALFLRLSAAIARGETFRVIVVLPVNPAFEGALARAGRWCLRVCWCVLLLTRVCGCADACAGEIERSSNIKVVMHWQNLSIGKGADSLLARLRAAHPAAKLRDYITFTALRQHAVRNGKLYTEQIYVHSKCMVRARVRRTRRRCMARSLAHTRTRGQRTVRAHADRGRLRGDHRQREHQRPQHARRARHGDRAALPGRRHGAQRDGGPPLARQPLRAHAAPPPAGGAHGSRASPSPRARARTRIALLARCRRPRARFSRAHAHALMRRW